MFLVLLLLFGTFFFAPIKAEDVPPTDVTEVDEIVVEEDSDPVDVVDQETDFSDLDGIPKPPKPPNPEITSIDQSDQYIYVKAKVAKVDQPIEVYFSKKKNGGNTEAVEMYSNGDFYGESVFTYRSRKPVKTGQTYYIKVRSVVEWTINKDVYSDWVVKKVKAGPSNVMKASVVLQTNTLIITWPKVKGNNGYEVKVWNDGGSMGSFNPGKNSKQLKLDVTTLGLDLVNKATYVEINAKGKKGTLKDQGNKKIWLEKKGDTSSTPVSNVNISQNAAGTEVIVDFFTLKSPLIDPPLRRGTGFNKALHEYGQDYVLFVATSKSGPYKRVDANVEFTTRMVGTPPFQMPFYNGRLTYKPKTGQRLYYKVVPTLEFIGEWYGGDYPFRDSENYTAVFDSAASPTPDDFTMTPGKPLNIIGKATSKKKAKISVDKGVKIAGYELWTDSGKMIKRQKSNVFKITGKFTVTQYYQIRAYRMYNKKRVYSEWSDIVAVTPY